MTALLLAVVGLMHVPRVKLWYLQATGQACPFGGGSGSSAKEYDAQMHAVDASLRGSASAAGRPALGLDLVTTQREAFESWVHVQGGHCYPRDHGLTLECAEMPLSKISDVVETTRGTLWARFDTANRLRELTAISRAGDSTSAARALSILADRLTQQAGPPHAQHGEASATYLARGGLTQSVAEYRFTDYYAKVSATNMGPRGGYRILQQYRSLAD